jgi:hypothetical protein
MEKIRNKDDEEFFAQLGEAETPRITKSVPRSVPRPSLLVQEFKD